MGNYLSNVTSGYAAIRGTTGNFCNPSIAPNDAVKNFFRSCGHHSLFSQIKDNYAIQSFEHGIFAQENDAFGWEIVPVEVSGRRGKPSRVIDKDEGLGKFDAAKLCKLWPSFKENGGSLSLAMLPT